MFPVVSSPASQIFFEGLSPIQRMNCCHDSFSWTIVCPRSSSGAAVSHCSASEAMVSGHSSLVASDGCFYVVVTTVCLDSLNVIGNVWRLCVHTTVSESSNETCCEYKTRCKHKIYVSMMIHVTAVSCHAPPSLSGTI